MRLTQKELDLIDKCISKRPRVPCFLKEELGDAFFKPLPDEELKWWNSEDESPEIIEAFNKSVGSMPKAKKKESIYTDEELDELDTWTSPPPNNIRTFSMKAQYKGRKKPLPYVLDEEF